MTHRRHFTTAVTLTPAEANTLTQIRQLFESLAAAVPHPKAVAADGLQTRRSTDTPRMLTMGALTPRLSTRRPRRSLLHYLAVDRRTKLPTDLADTDTRLYAYIVAAKGGRTRPQCLAHMHAEDRTGIVDGALRRLRLHRLIKTLR